MRRIYLFTLFLIIFFFIQPLRLARAQTYSFSVPQMSVDVFWEADGSVRILYEILFANDPLADDIDFIDIGIPTEAYSISAVSATINGNPIGDIERSPYVQPGVALGLGANAIAPGAQGVVRVSIPGVRNALFVEDQEGYASALFSPTWFDAQLVHGTSDLTATFHLPPGVLPEQPRWHDSPSGWPQHAPQSGLDSEGRIIYSWHNAAANSSSIYVFGASFPSEYIPEETLQQPTVLPRFRISQDLIASVICGSGFVLFTALIVIVGNITTNRRKMDYLPPKISIEGHGIKRGLTAVEAAILLETDLDKVLTMILFSSIKKSAIKVVREDPLEIEKRSAQPEGLRAYESNFVEAMLITGKRIRQKALQDLVIKLVKTTQKKMKGFSLRETKAYYRSIVKQAWNQVESAETPEIRSQRFDESIEWTMLDRNFDGRTRNVFRSGPVYVPYWWSLYRPSMASAGGGASGPAATPTRTSVTTSRAGGLPTLPGADFAASVVQGIQQTAGNLISNVTQFTGGGTKATNPPPPPSRYSGRSSGGGSSCACACAGGGR